MSDVRVVREVSSVSRGTSDGDLMALRGTRDGAVFSADWYLAAALEGRAFGVNCGVQTSPVSYNATPLVVAEPDVCIYVPVGTTIIPVYVEYAIEDTGGNAALEIVAGATSAAQVITAGDSKTIHNMRTDEPRQSNCTAASVMDSTGKITPYTGNYIEFFRGYAGDSTDQFNSSTAQTVNTATRFHWSVGKTMVPPILTGRSAFFMYLSGTLVTAFVTVIWVEFPSSSIV